MGTKAPKAKKEKAAKKEKGASKPKTPAAHPPFANMIAASIKALKERNGSSRQAILKYIVANYKVGDASKAQTRVKIALRKMVEAKKIEAGGASGKKGAGCSKLVAAAKPAEKSKKAAVKKPKVKKAAKKPAAAAKKSKKQQRRNLQPRSLLRKRQLQKRS